MPLDPSEKQWFAMRDLSRRNANVMAHDTLRNEGLEVFTPLTQLLITIHGRKHRRLVPVIQDLLFVHESKQRLDPFVARYANLQYRYCLGKTVDEPATVREADMQRFIRAVGSTDTPRYFIPGELTASMYGRRVRIIGGPLDNFEGHLLSVRGMRTRRIIVEIPGLISSAVEVKPEFIQFI